MDNNYNMIMKWFENQLDKKYWADYLSDYGYSRVAVYGAGELGKYLERDLRGTAVSIGCFIDRNAEMIGNVCGIPVKTLDDFMNDRCGCEAVIVSVISVDRSVLLDVLERDSSIPVLSLRDMIYEL